MKTMPHIEEVQIKNGKTAYQAFDPVNMTVCGHRHRYEMAAQACLKEMQRARHLHLATDIEDDGDGRQYCKECGTFLTVKEVETISPGYYTIPQPKPSTGIFDENTPTDVVTEVIDGRRGVYGQPVETYPRVAQIWSGITGAEITAEMVPLMLIGYKLLRAAVTPDYSDNSDDIEGYLAIFREVVGTDMIHARSVEEYLAVKGQR